MCWNALADLKLTVASVQQQDYASLRHIVIDGNSTDGTVAYLAENAGLFDVAISEPDRGIYDAMNKAAGFCGDDSWVIFLNAGDRFATNSVLNCLQPHFQQDVDFVLGDVAIRGDDAAPKVYPARRESPTDMPACHQSTLVRAELLKRNKFDVNYRVGADFDFFLRSTRPVGRLAFYGGVISEIAPEGFSAKNEAILQKDYYASILSNVGLWPARKWIFKRKLRQLLLGWRTHLTRAGGGR